MEIRIFLKNILFFLKIQRPRRKPGSNRTTSATTAAALATTTSPATSPATSLTSRSSSTRGTSVSLQKTPKKNPSIFYFPFFVPDVVYGEGDESLASFYFTNIKCFHKKVFPIDQY